MRECRVSVCCNVMMSYLTSKHDNTVSYWQFAKILFQNVCLNLIKKHRIKLCVNNAAIKIKSLYKNELNEHQCCACLQIYRKVSVEYFHPPAYGDFTGRIHVRCEEINNNAFPKHPEKEEIPSNRQQNYYLTIAENTALSSLTEGIKTRQGKTRFILSRLNK